MGGVRVKAGLLIRGKTKLENLIKKLKAKLVSFNY